MICFVDTTGRGGGGGRFSITPTMEHQMKENRTTHKGGLRL